MANNLPIEKQIMAISALAEGTSIRSIERMTGVHRDTIMRLGVRVGQGCERLLDKMMVNLPCKNVQVDELWGFIGKKQKNVRKEDAPKQLGDVWTFVALDADTKLVPCYRVGKRNQVDTRAFVEDLAKRVENRIQLSSDGWSAYIDAVEHGFHGQVDYGQIVKIFASTLDGVGKYSPPKLVSTESQVFNGTPQKDLISTSFVEKNNHTIRMHCRRLSRLTNAFSKKLDNFKSAVGLHFGYYNLVKVHTTLRATPAMASGVTKSIWTVGELIERAQATN